MITLTRKAAQMMHLAVREAPQLEVLGFGKVEIDDGSIIVTDIRIPPQEVGQAHTDLEDENLRDWIVSLADDGMVLADWPFWWHSHCSMTVSPSGTDVTTLRTLADAVPGLGWFVGLVTNVRDEYHAWINTTRPVPLNAVLTVQVQESISPALADEVKGMMTKVHRTSYLTKGGVDPLGASGPAIRNIYSHNGVPPVSAPTKGKAPLPAGMLADLGQGSHEWEAWLRRFPNAVNQRLRNMSKPALQGLRSVFGSDLIDALFDRDDEMLAIMDFDDTFHSQHKKAAYPMVCAKCAAESGVKKPTASSPTPVERAIRKHEAKQGGKKR